MVPFLCSLLIGKALERLSAMWSGGTVLFDLYAAFTQQLREVSHHSADGKDPSDLMELTQDQGHGRIVIPEILNSGGSDRLHTRHPEKALPPCRGS